MRRAVKDRLLTVMPTTDVERKMPPKDASVAHAQAHCWSPTEAKRVLDTAKDASVVNDQTQLAAYIYLALDSGARKSELDGLLWSDLTSTPVR
jgi:hypothetical protein